jgi:hypothetical protein
VGVAIAFTKTYVGVAITFPKSYAMLQLRTPSTIQSDRANNKAIDKMSFKKINGNPQIHYQTASDNISSF